MKGFENYKALCKYKVSEWGWGQGDRKYAGQVEIHTPLGGEHNSLTEPGRESSDLEALPEGKTTLDG